MRDLVEAGRSCWTFFAVSVRAINIVAGDAERPGSESSEGSEDEFASYVSLAVLPTKHWLKKISSPN